MIFNRIRPNILVEIVCRWLIAVALLEVIFIINIFVLGIGFDYLFYLGFIIMLCVWCALPSWNLFIFRQHPEGFE